MRKCGNIYPSLNFTIDDSSRVRLAIINDDPDSDYINASYIPVNKELFPKQVTSFKRHSER